MHNRYEQIDLLRGYLQDGQSFTTSSGQTFIGIYGKDRSFVYSDQPDALQSGTTITDPANIHHIVTRIDYHLPRVWITPAPYLVSVYRVDPSGSRDGFGRITTSPALIAEGVALGHQDGRYFASSLQDMAQGDVLIFSTGERFVIDSLQPAAEGIQPLILTSEQISPSRLSSM